jgi:hypothetical protein
MKLTCLDIIIFAIDIGAGALGDAEKDVRMYSVH